MSRHNHERADRQASAYNSRDSVESALKNQGRPRSPVAAIFAAIIALVLACIYAARH
jgi:hypothetical protein